MTGMYAKLISLGIGYLFGCILTAEIVAHKITGGSASKLGDTGNPGMANIMASLGFVPGIITLAGDLDNKSQLVDLMIDYEGNLDFQLETWLIALGKQEEIERWRASLQ